MAMSVFMAGSTYSEISAKAFGEDESVIVGFVGAVSPIASQYYSDTKPELHQLSENMPSVITAVMSDNSVEDIPVSWVCADGDYENTNYKYYSFLPVWDSDEYVISPEISENDFPYTAVFLADFAGFHGGTFSYDDIINYNGSAGSSYTGKESELEIYDFLTNELCFNYATAVGIMANIYKESGFDPNAYNPNDLGKESYGLCQWRDTRLTALKSYCSENGLDYTSAYGQMCYLQYELKTSEKNAWSHMQGFENTQQGAYDAACAWAQWFERCAHYYNGVDQYAQRGNLARNSFWGLYDIRYISPEIKCENMSCQTAFKAGSQSVFSGTVTSEMYLIGASVKVVDADGGEKINFSCEPLEKSLDLSTLSVELGGLSAGVYRLTVSVANADHAERVIDSIVTVTSNTMTVSEGSYKLLCKDDSSKALTGGSAVMLDTDNDSAEQEWYVQYVGAGYYTVRNVGSGLYLSIANGSDVLLAEKNDSDEQCWQILRSGSAYYLVPKCAEGCSVGSVDGKNVSLDTSSLNENQRYILSLSNGDISKGHKIVFDANGGVLPSAVLTYTADGVNRSRGAGELIVYNVPDVTVMTNIYGIEVQTDNSGMVIAKREYGSSDRFTVISGGMVLSGHLCYGNDGGEFVDKIKTGNYAGFDASTNLVSVYLSEDGYLADFKYVSDNSAYGKLPVPEKSGYVFDGWYTEAEGGTRITEDSIYCGNLLHAHWRTEQPVNEEAVSEFVERLYLNILNRSSDPEGKENHIKNLKNGETACKVAYDFVFSSEFLNLDITNEERVRRMYLTFLDREPDSEGLANWTSTLDGGCSVGHIFYGFTQSNEFSEICEKYGINRGVWEYTENRDRSSKLTAFVARLYTKAMGREYDINGLNDHTGNYLKDGDLYRLAYNFIFSAEYLNKNLSDEDFLENMYATFFNRPSDENGKNGWLKSMQNGMSREEVLAGFVGSKECADMVAGFGL